MDEQEQPLSLVLFSGTDDKLTAASVLITPGTRRNGSPTAPQPAEASADSLA